LRRWRGRDAVAIGVADAIADDGAADGAAIPWAMPVRQTQRLAETLVRGGGMYWRDDCKHLILRGITVA